MKHFTLLKFLFLTSFFPGGNILLAQHLNYPDRQDGDIIMNEVQVTDKTDCSYWETMGWNVGGEGGAYCGIQYSGTDPLFIYSIWDPSNHQPITAPYSFPKSKIESFGGEGTGLHYIDEKLTGWQLNTWVRLVSRRWDYKGHSYFGFWTYDYGTKKWKHHVTMDYPVANVKFNSGGTNSFLEDWCGSPGNYRKGLYGNGYKRNMSGVWIPFKTASYSGNSSNDNRANAGIQNGAYFMEFGGNTVKTVKEGQVLTITIPATPVVTIGQVASATVSLKTDSALVSWVTDDSKSPQFSYTVKLISPSGAVLLTKTDIVPHLRKISLYTKGLPDGVYTVKVTMVDIFDQASNEIDNPITIGNPNGVNNTVTTLAGNFTISPNPCHTSANVLSPAGTGVQAELSVYDITGRMVIGALKISADQTRLDLAGLRSGIYYVQVCDPDNHILQRIKLVKESDF
jgi:Domain of unknown function (DUF3472)/Secretion system C-terminal sorting domain